MRKNKFLLLKAMIYARRSDQKGDKISPNQ